MFRTNWEHELNKHMKQDHLTEKHRQTRVQVGSVTQSEWETGEDQYLRGTEQRDELRAGQQTHGKPKQIKAHKYKTQNGQQRATTKQSLRMLTTLN